MNHEHKFNWCGLRPASTGLWRRLVSICVTVQFELWPIMQIPESTRHCPNVVLMLAHRLRRWTNFTPTLGQCLVFAGTGRPQRTGAPSQMSCIDYCAEWPYSHGRVCWTFAPVPELFEETRCALWLAPKEQTENVPRAQLTGTPGPGTTVNLIPLPAGQSTSK